MEQPNISYIQSMSAGDVAFEKKIIAIIKEEFPLERAEYTNNFKSKEFDLAAQNVHKLKHKISILGLKKSYDIAVAFEYNLLDGNIELNEDFESILDTIAHYLNQL